MPADEMITHAFHATPARHAPVKPGYVMVRGLSREGIPVACRLPEGSRAADRLASDSAERRRYMADRRRLSTIFDEPGHEAEKSDLLARLNSRNQ